MTKCEKLINNIADSEQIILQLKKELQLINAPLDICFDIQLAITEAINNAFMHGCKNKPEPWVMVEWEVNKNYFQFTVKDNGGGFDTGQIKKNCADNLLDEHGRGIFLIEQVLDKVWFNKKGNAIHGFKSW